VAIQLERTPLQGIMPNRRSAKQKAAEFSQKIMPQKQRARAA
jgi:hypothetical protein